MGVGSWVLGLGSWVLGLGWRSDDRATPNTQHPTPNTRRLLSLIALLATTACAVVQEPPGGPPDFDPPTLLEVVPDSGAVVPELDDPLEFRFDEVVSERSGGGLDRLIEMSPRADQLDIDWKRTRVAVRPEGGWRAGLVYHVTLLPGMADLRNNRMTDGRTVVFSTGGEIPDTRLQGVVLDWANGRVPQRALVEAVLLPDSLVYTTLPDSIGEFVLTALPRGTYHVSAALDGNGNRRREPREPFDSVTVTLDSAIDRAFWTFAQDTVGPSIRQATPADSLTMRLEFGQPLQPGEPDTGAVSLFALPDTIAVAVAWVGTAGAYDSLVAAERADTSVGAEGAEGAERAGVADTVGAEAAADTAAARRPPVRELPLMPGARPEAAADTAQAADSTRAQRLLATRRPLATVWVVRAALPLTPGGRYLVEARARNPNGVEATSRAVVVVPMPPDST